MRKTSKDDRLREGMKGRCGFTLIELLTVIAIIGILAAILIPVVARVRQTAQAAQCVSNLRQIGNATFLYLADNDGFFFPARDEGSRLNVLGKRGVHRQRDATQRPLNPYLDAISGPDDSLEVLHCPGDNGEVLPSQLGGGGFSSYDSTGSSYHPNIHGFIGLKHVGHVPIHESEIVEPTRFVMFAEDPAIQNAFGSSGHRRGWHWETAPIFNLLFADGHVERHEVRDGWTHTREYSFYRNPADAPAPPSRPGR